jgi:DNA-binding transcriptional regulator YiaG
MKKATVSKTEVKAARAAAGLTQREAAAVIGYTRRAFQDWETGKRNMRRVLYEQFLQKTQ